MSEYLLNARIRKRRHPEYWYRQRHRECWSDRQCAPNILGRNFTSIAPLKKLVTDVTWVTFAGGTLYLSAIMDVFNHEIISYEIRTRNTTATALAPILRLLRATNCEGALLHCDRGPTYRSEEYQTLLARNKIISSYSRAGNCWDNALMECFFGHLKCELGYIDGSTRKRSFHCLAQEITDYIAFYNERRIQKNLGWTSPLQYRIQSYGEIESKKMST
jgi:putative transposase